jgi:hypothetical protein
LILRAQLLVEADIGLVLVVHLVGHTTVVVRRPHGCGQREACEQRDRHRIHPVLRNRAVGKRCAREAAGTVGDGRRRVVDHGHAAGNRLGEDALPLQRRWHGGDHGAADVLPLPLVVDEEERPVSTQWATEHAAELVAAEFRLDRVGRREEVARVQRLVPEELEAGPAERVRTRLRGEVHHPAVEASELGRRAVGFDLELLNRVHDRVEGHLTRLGLQHRDAVEQVFVGTRPAAVDARELRAGRQRDTGYQRRQRDEGAAVQRQRRNGLLGDHLAQAGGGAQRRGVAGDRDRFRQATDHQLKIELARQPCFNPHAFSACGAEAAQFDNHSILARAKPAERVQTGR